MAASLALLKTQKQSLRTSMRSALRSLSQADLENQSQAITDRLLSLTGFASSSSVSCYLSMPTAEARTTAIIDAILQDDKRLYVPKIQSKDGIMDFLRIYSREDLESLPSGTWGIKEPSDSWKGEKRHSVLGTTASSSPSNVPSESLASNTNPLDVIILPGVAFDRTFHRLGHGKGYYDRFISSYVASGRVKPLLVGICLREQLLASGEVVPHGDHDWSVDVIVTPDDTLVKQ